MASKNCRPKRRWQANKCGKQGSTFRGRLLHLLYRPVHLPEIWIVAGVTEWSIVSLFGLGDYGYVILSVLLAPLACWASWKTAVLAWSAERELALNPDQ
ncbi:MAG: hypothetical protein R3D29_10675 [Nitratireductor sp.]